MNAYQQKMYDDLLALTNGSETFYFQDFVLDGRTYRIFNYRLSSYSEFMRPSALECRGHMFEITGGDPVSAYYDVPLRLAALPMQKFFNLNENPMTIGLDLSQVDTVELKADGSLITTYIHNDQLRFKSKGSLSSDQAVAAMKWIDTQPAFKRALYSLAQLKWSVNLEWCAPDNRIVIGYETPHLKVLNARNVETGKYLPRNSLEDVVGIDNMIERVDTNGLDVAAFVQSIPDMLDDIEGYVARIGDLWFKVKTNKYMSLHHTKDSINNPRRLFEAVLDEGVDDLRAMFFEDKLAIKLIDEMTEKVDKIYNHMVALVEKFYEDNKSLDRKDYAIKGQAELDRLYFGLAMTKYLQKPVDYKGFMKSKYKEFGIRDEVPELEVTFETMEAA